MPLNAAFNTVGLLRFTNGIVLPTGNRRFTPSPVPCAPMGRSRPSLYPDEGWWHVAHATSLPPDRIGSQNSRRPRATLSGVRGLLAGAAGCTGRAVKTAAPRG